MCFPVVGGLGLWLLDKLSVPEASTHAAESKLAHLA